MWIFGNGGGSNTGGVYMQNILCSFLDHSPAFLYFDVMFILLCAVWLDSVAFCCIQWTCDDGPSIG